MITAFCECVAGGFDRHADSGEMVESFRGKVKAAVLLGTTAPAIEAAIREVFPEMPVLRVGTMAEAVRSAAGLAQAGDTVLLSPACASWDMYPNFEIRGEEFKRLAKEEKE